VAVLDSRSAAFPDLVGQVVLVTGAGRGQGRSQCGGALAAQRRGTAPATDSRSTEARRPADPRYATGETAAVTAGQNAANAG
jgi:NAD(P)-dependent dehydrogenase (short-subunit alcohol dehydrogenase family)